MSERPEEGSADQDEKWSWSFILLLVAGTIYLGWRAIQGIAWLVDRVGG